MNKLVFTLLTVFCYSLCIVAQNTLKIDVLNGSKIFIDGDASIIKFRIYQSSTNFLEDSHHITFSKLHNKIFLNKNEINVPVKSFESNNKMALRDFLKMMDVKNYNYLNIKLNYVEIFTDKNIENKGNAVMDFTIKGVTKKINFPLAISKFKNIYTLNSSKQINIKDFNLTAPTALAGLIKVKDVIDIHLYFVLQIEQVK